MTWIFRAALIQGIQQVYLIFLWYFGSLATTPSTPAIVAITIPIALILLSLSVISLLGLPDYYRQSPDTIPSFYKSLLRRHIIPWFFLYVILTNYFFSPLYGRSWSFLFSSQHLPAYATILLSLGFFVGLWALALWIFAKLSKSHPWILPLFSIGLLSPRWAQLLWATSGIGLYLPWLRNAVLSALVSRSLWLWLGVLDTIQGVGLGMVLLLTLTRQHVAATLMGAQVLGAGFTILGRATAPCKEGPGDVFPDFSGDLGEAVGRAWFWVVLGVVVLLPVGFFKFFRKEQVAKP